MCGIMLTKRSIYQTKVKDLVATKGGVLEDSWEYVDSTEKFWVTCAQGHKWQTCWNVLQSNHWCPECALKSTLIRIANSRISEDLVRKYIEDKKGKLDSQWHYTNNHEKFWVECEHRHRWQTLWNNVRSGHWCPYCKKTIVIEKDVKAHIEKNGGVLSRDWVYVSATEKFELRCESGHTFKTSWDKIRSGHWCPSCYGNTQTDGLKVKSFIEQKGGKLDHTWKYINSIQSFWVTCKKGHRWETHWGSIRQGHWCPRCVDTKSENEFREVMERTFLVTFPKQKPGWLVNPNTGRRLELDGYNENIKIAFEYQGPYHFENVRNTHLEQQKRDEIKLEKCQERGIRLIVIPYWIPKKDWEIEIQNQICMTKRKE